VALARVFELLDFSSHRGAQVPAVRPQLLPVARAQCALALSWEQLSFGYARRALVLHSLDGFVRAGTTTALIGPSGSGKSTLIRLLSGLDEPTDGQVRVGEQLLSGMSTADRRRSISVVWPDPGILYGSLWDNITLGLPGLTEADVQFAVRLCHLEPVIRSLPDGLYELLAEAGTSLSVGERQRVVLARAVLRRAPILLLDEATSNLDAATERCIFEGLHALVPRPTILFTSHRAALWTCADEVYSMPMPGALASVSEREHDDVVESRAQLRFVRDDEVAGDTFDRGLAPRAIRAQAIPCARSGRA
ncbi:MAG: ABC transporter ATP-binding protein, partial [Gemmatimonas sp.]